MQLEPVLSLALPQDIHPAQEDTGQKSSDLAFQVLGSLVGGPQSPEAILRLGEGVKAGKGLRPAFAALSKSDQEFLFDKIGNRSLQQLLAITFHPVGQRNGRMGGGVPPLRRFEPRGEREDHRGEIYFLTIGLRREERKLSNTSNRMLPRNRLPTS